MSEDNENNDFNNIDDIDGYNISANDDINQENKVYKKSRYNPQITSTSVQINDESFNAFL